MLNSIKHTLKKSGYDLHFTFLSVTKNQIKVILKIMLFSHQMLTDRNLEQSIVVLSASVDIIIVLGKSELKMENHQEQMLSLIKLVASPSSWDVSDSEFP